MRHRIARLTIPSLGCGLIAILVSFAVARAGQQSTPDATRSVIGQSVTQLPDGRWLVVGGIGPSGAIRALVVVESAGGTGSALRLEPTLNDARGWHSATILPDGRVLITGGVGEKGQVIHSAEVFDPELGTVQVIPWLGTARAHHTTTVLRDGRVLIAGGFGSDQSAIETVETFDPASFEVRALAGNLLSARQDHTATLLPNGAVRFDGGLTSARNRDDESEIYHPVSQVSRRAERREAEYDVAALAFASPANGDEVSGDTRIVLHFTKPLAVQSLQSALIQLQNEDGTAANVRTVLAEGGRLLFLTPERPLTPGQPYRVMARNLVDTTGILASDVSLTFRIRPDGSSIQSDEEWAPRDYTRWRTDRERSPWQSLPALQAAPGVTALSGQILLLNGSPLANVTLKVGGQSGTSDHTGRFLVTDVATGAQTLVIDGRSASAPGRVYGVFLSRVDPKPGETTVLSYTIWMPRIDTTHAVSIRSPLSSDLVLTTALIPGLEVHIPKGSVIRDHDGRPASQINITPIPVDRTPFPLPTGIEVPVYFTIQPGGGFIETPNTPWPSGARVIYPNFTQARPGTDFQFWNYDPEDRGWHVYGQGAVNAAGVQVVPRPGVVIYRFTGTMITVPGLTPPPIGPAQAGKRDGDPVDLATGLFVLEKTDLYLADVMPLSLTRTYRQNDSDSRPFGIGATHPYAMFLWSAQQYQEADLVLPDGERVHYVRTSPGTGYADAVFEHTTSPGPFYKSKIDYHDYPELTWHLRLRDGTIYIFGDTAPLKAIRDRHGNQITVTLVAGQTNVAKVSSPNGRFIEFTYDASKRITQAKDNIGRTVGYQYDVSGRLWKVTDPAGGVTEYTYDTSHRMLTLKDARGITYLTNQYDANGRVSLQTQADSTTYQFAYTLDGSARVIQTDVTNPRGHVTRTYFNTSKYATSQIEAVGTAQARTTTWTRDSTTHRVSRVTDGLSRNTDFTYDSLGNVASVTRLAGTADAVTTNFTYESTFSQLATLTDPLSHTTTFTRNSTGDVTTITDPLSHQATLTYNTAGQALTVTTPAGTTSFSYDLGDLVSITDPLSQVTARYLDAAGRLVRITNPLGQTTRYEYDALDATQKEIDALGGETTFTYDANGNLLTLTDARNNTTSYTYNNMNRVTTRTDPLTRQESFTYDNNGNLTQIADRKSQLTSYTYDPLNRQTQATYHDNSTTTNSYDAGDRLTQVVDSIAGTITRGYDLLDRLTSEATPEGTVNYTYDAADRRATMTVVGQTQITYNYDSANRLTSIAQGSSSVGFSYDSADRRSVLTLPNGVTIESAYNAASQVTGLTYKLGSNTLGDLTYTYDNAGNRTATGGTWARSGLPASMASATYDSGNQVSTWAGTSISHDNNGNLTGDGSKTYTWNARNQLTALSGSVTASFQYDGLDRRRSKTISGTSVSFLYDSLNVIQELSGGSPTANILPGLNIDQWYVRTGSAGTDHLLVDALNSTVALTNGSGVVQTEYTYEPFGKSSFSGAASVNSTQFTGRENDGTGLSFYRARYYDPTSSRFVSEDPIGRQGGPNFYSYASNNPVRWSDPFGLKPCDCNDPPDRDKYYSCVIYYAAGEGLVRQAACLVVGAATGFVTGFVCSMANAAYYRVKCTDCASPCPKAKDCLTNNPRQPPWTRPPGPPTPDFNRPLPPGVR